MSDTPLVSVAMPVFNGAQTIESAIRSVLYQTYENWELVLIEDGSTDETLAKARKFKDSRIRIISDGTNQGHGARLNQAVELSRGKYIARMDQDDLCFPERFELQVDFLEENQDVDLLGTRAIVFADGGMIKGISSFRQLHNEICQRPWSGFYMPHPTWMGRTQWFRKFRYQLDVNRAEDQDLLLRSYASSNFACLPDILLGYRLNELSIRKTLPGRYSFAKSVIRWSLHKRVYGVIPLALAAQIIKSIYESAAVVSGLERFFLKHRARPFTDEQIIRRWNRCWNNCQF
jgi:glycosyltransferase involved in cell wall biosynthesis